MNKTTKKKLQKNYITICIIRGKALWELEIGKGKGPRFILGLKFVGFKVLSLNSRVLKFRVLSPKVFGPILFTLFKSKIFLFLLQFKKTFFFERSNQLGYIIKDESIGFLIGSCALSLAYAWIEIYQLKKTNVLS